MSDLQPSAGKQFVEYLKAHPRALGALFTLCLLASQTGSVAAANGGAIS
ncbi:DUF7503 family protein [Natrononativus amylolyticus]|nr:hypothetical protein [Natrononativus amylolyticus]